MRGNSRRPSRLWARTWPGSPSPRSCTRWDQCRRGLSHQRWRAQLAAGHTVQPAGRQPDTVRQRPGWLGSGQSWWRGCWFRGRGSLPLHRWGAKLESGGACAGRLAAARHQVGHGLDSQPPRAGSPAPSRVPNVVLPVPDAGRGRELAAQSLPSSFPIQATQPPVFFSASEGLLPVTLNTTQGPSFAIYATRDGGATWSSSTLLSTIWQRLGLVS